MILLCLNLNMKQTVLFLKVRKVFVRYWAIKTDTTKHYALHPSVQILSDEPVRVSRDTGNDIP